MTLDDLQLDDLPWQDIHEAPRDGRPVTLLLPSRAGWEHSKPQRWCDRVRQAQWHPVSADLPQAGWDFIEQHGLPKFFMPIPAKHKLQPTGWMDMRTNEFFYDYWRALHLRETL